MRIHLGHHFFGAGNLGDDLMLAGFLAAMRALAPRTTFSGCVPFDLHPLRQRFPEIEWLPYEADHRARSIAACDVWLGLGGSPFQSALSRWFIDHLVGDAALCIRHRKRMFYLGIGVQTASELAVPETQQLIAQAAGIWTRDEASAARLAALPHPPRPLESASDLAHLFFRDNPPPAAAPGRITLVPNFDYGTWPGQVTALRAFAALPIRERIWLAQESRELPGAERALHAGLPDSARETWRLVVPEIPGAPLPEVLAHWPSGEWLVTARFHAAWAGAWARSRIVVLATNEKLRAVARELGCPLVSPEATPDDFARAFEASRPAGPLPGAAERAYAACAAFVQAAA